MVFSKGEECSYNRDKVLYRYMYIGFISIIFNIIWLLISELCNKLK